MLENEFEPFAGKTILSIKAVPFSKDTAIPFSLVIKFTDGSGLQTDCWAANGFHPFPGRAAWHFGPDTRCLFLD